MPDHPAGARVRLTGGRFAGRTGTVTREPRTFADYRYVHIDPTPRERVKKVEMVDVRHLAPLCPKCGRPHTGRMRLAMAELTVEVDGVRTTASGGATTYSHADGTACRVEET